MMRKKGFIKVVSKGVLLVYLSVLAGPAIAADTLPTGGQVVQGNATISQTASRMDINQSSQRAVINWQGFDIGSQSQVNFYQPNSSSVALNRVLSSNPSQIQGSLNANGQVFLLNPNGIIFGKGASVNTGGIVASTMNITDNDFMNGRYSFERNGSTGSIFNSGSISAADGGYVALLAPEVINEGIISARMGTVATGAGEKISLDFRGDSLVGITVDPSAVNTLIENRNLIRADGGNVIMSTRTADGLLSSLIKNSGIVQAQTLENKNGTIVLSGGSVSNSGTLDASGQNSGETGGTVKMLGNSVDLQAGANVNVSGDSGGGTALIGGNYQGQGPEQNAQTANMAAGATINADAVTSGNGGLAVLWADGTTTMDGTITACGGATGGNGGHVETSGKQKLTVGNNARVTTLAPLGNAGNWLLDPNDFTIYASGDTGDMLDSTVITALNSGNVTIQTTAGSPVCIGLACGAGTAGNGDITVAVNAWVTWNTANTLTLSAYRDVNINGWVETTTYGTNGSIVLRADNAGTGIGAVNIAAGTYGAGGTSYIGTGGTGSTTIYTNTPASTNGYAANAVDYFGTFNIFKLVAPDTAGVVSAKAYDGNTTASLSTPFGLTGAPAGATLTAGTAAFADKNAGNGKTVTFSGYSASGATTIGAIAANYFLSRQPADKTANITQKALTATITATNKTYDGNATATPTFTITGGLVGAETVTATGVATFADKNAGVGKTVTANSATLADGTNGGLAANYNLAAGQTTTANIDPKALTVTGMIAGNKTYDGNITATLSGGALSGFVGAETVTVSGGSGAFADKNAGTGKAVTVSGVTLADGTNGGLAANYSVTNPVGLTASIDPKALTATITAVNKTYDGNTTATPTFTITGGLVGAETVTATGAATFADKNAGVGKTVTANTATLADGTNGGLAANYSLATGQTTTADITPKALTATITATNKTYDGNTTATPTFTITGGLVGAETVTATGAATFADKNAGVGKTVTANTATLADGTNGGLAANYSLATGQTTTANIDPKALTITGMTANNKVYDGTTTATLAGGGTLSGFVGAETVTASGGTGTFADKNAATGKAVTVSGVTLADGTNGGLAANYTVTSPVGLTADITPKALTATITAVNKSYDGNTTATPTFTITGGLVGTETVTATGAATFADKNAGVGKTVTANTATLADGTNGGLAANYSLATGQTTTATINPANLTLSGTRVYDATTIVAGATLTATGVNGETFAVTGAGDATNLASKNVQVASALNSVTGLTLGAGANGGVASNYNALGTVGSTYTVTQAAITLTGITATSKVYDGNTTAALNTTSVNFTGKIGADAVGLNGTGTGTFADKNVGNGKTVTVSGYTLNGADAPNYTVAQPSGLTANITPKAVTVSGITAANKVYDATTAATVNAGGAVFTGMVGGDTLNITSVTGTFTDKNVANGKTVTLSGTTYGGADAGNYSFTNQASTTANITSAPLTVTANAGTKTYGAVDPTLTYNTTGFVGGDTAASLTGTLGRTAGETVAGGPYAINQGTLANPNYAITFNGANFTITPAPLTVTANDASKVANGTAYAGGNGVTYTGFKFTDTATSLGGALTYGGTSQGASAVGTYLITPAGHTSTNYAITYVDGTLTIAAAPQSNTIDAGTLNKIANSNIHVSQLFSQRPNKELKELVKILPSTKNAVIKESNGSKSSIEIFTNN